MKVYQKLFGFLIVLLFLSGCQEITFPGKNMTSSAPDFPQVPSPNPIIKSPPLPSADCKKIAFVLSNGNNSDIYTICPDGTERTQLTNSPAYDLTPAWSPDGKKLAFASLQTGSSQIYIMDANGNNPIQITFEHENNFPIWLPDGLQIAFRSTGSQGLWWWEIVNIATGQIVRYAEASYDFFFQTPAWSPDGRKIAYMSLVEQSQRNDGSSQIHVKNVDNSNDISLTNDIWANTNPIWSPDGNRIAFLSERDGNYYRYGLYIISSEGKNLQRITDPIFTEHCQLAWSPDGQEIAIDNRLIPSPIRIINLETGQSRELFPLQDGENAFSPSWQP